MFCGKCGQPVPDGGKFCPKCGAPVAASEPVPAAPIVPPVEPPMDPPAAPVEPPVTPVAAPVEPPVTPAPTPAEPSAPPAYIPPQPSWEAPAPAPAAPAGPVLADNPVRALRSSPLFLVGVIAYSVTALFTLISFFKGLMDLSSMGSMLSDIGLGGVGAGVGSISVITSAVSLLLVALVTAGLWMVFASGLGEGNDTMCIKGLGMVQGVMTTYLVLVCVLFGILALVLLVAMVAGGNALIPAISTALYMETGVDFSGAMAAGVGVIFLLFVAVGVLAIVFYAKLRGSVRVARETLMAERVVGLPSCYVAVLCIIAGAVNLFLMIPKGLLGGGLQVFNTLASIVANIIFGVVIFVYRSHAHSPAATQV